MRHEVIELEDGFYVIDTLTDDLIGDAFPSLAGAWLAAEELNVLAVDGPRLAA